MASPIAEHPPNMGYQRNVRDQVSGEKLSALIDFAFGEAVFLRGQPDAAAFELGEAQEMQGLGSGKEVVDLQLRRARERRRFGLTSVGLAGWAYGLQDHPDAPRGSASACLLVDAPASVADWRTDMPASKAAACPFRVGKRPMTGRHAALLSVREPDLPSCQSPDRHR